MKFRITFFIFSYIAVLVGAQDIISTSNSSLSQSELISMRNSYVMVNTDYPVTPGDTYQLSYLLSTETVQLSFYVESDYTINLAFLGKFNVKGQTFRELKFFVENKVLNAYSDSVPSVTISSPGTFNVLVKGEVVNSVLVPAWSFDRLSSILSGKTTEYASFRNVEVRSVDGTSKFYDLFRASRFGELENDPYVKSGDEVIVHPYLKKIVLEGEVKRPGIYELLPEDTLNDVIINYGNGFTKLADVERIRIKRYSSETNEFGETVYIDSNELNLEDFTPVDMDIINIAQRLDHQPVVYFQGAIGTSNAGTTVSNKIPYTILPGEKLSSAARNVNDQFTTVSDLEKAFVIRSGSGEKIYSNIQDLLLKGDEVNEVVLKDGDIVVIPFRQYLVYVGGQVNSPGNYPYIVNKTWEYYVGLAGGFNIDNHIGSRVRITDVYGDKHKQDERIIEPEDVIYAPLNHPLYWLKEYGDDLALITATVTSTIIMVNYLGQLIDADYSGIPAP